MKLSIVVINKNRGNVIKSCLQAIIKQKVMGDELLVIDDNSNDNSVKKISEVQNGIDYFYQIDSKGNRSVVRNTGAKLAKNEVILFIDSDIIIGPENLKLTREAHKDIKVVGTNGNVACNSCDVGQFEFMTQKIPDKVLPMLEQDFSIIYEFTQFFDYRYFNKDMTSDEYKNWLYYYTSYASVRNDAFTEICGFDENFKTWGSEDIEFAYRLNKLGKIVFQNDVVSFHYPHKKNMYTNYLNNINNLYYMLNKYKNMEFEIYTSFLTGEKEDVMCALKKLNEYIALTDNSEMKLENKQICIHFPNKQYKEGLVEYQLDNKKQKMELFGYALPFVDRSLDKMYISKKCRLIPEAVLCRVLQEALRIANEVFVEKGEIERKPFYNMGEFYNSNPLLFGIFYISTRILDFEFIDYNSKFYQVKWKKNVQINHEKIVYNI